MYAIQLPILLAMIQTMLLKLAKVLYVMTIMQEFLMLAEDAILIAKAALQAAHGTLINL